MGNEYCPNSLIGIELISEANKPSETPADNAETIEINFFIAFATAPALEIQCTDYPADSRQALGQYYVPSTQAETPPRVTRIRISSDENKKVNIRQTPVRTPIWSLYYTCFMEHSMKLSGFPFQISSKV